MDKHISYEKAKNRECDFIVQYRFFSEEEGGRKINPGQGYRSDFMYAEDEKFIKLFMIWPEFLDNKNNVILNKAIHVSTCGRAKMWMVTEANYELHKSRIKIGLKGYFMEGPRKVAECEVVEILRLK